MMEALSKLRLISNTDVDIQHGRTPSFRSESVNINWRSRREKKCEIMLSKGHEEAQLFLVVAFLAKSCAPFWLWRTFIRILQLASTFLSARVIYWTTTSCRRSINQIKTASCSHASLSFSKLLFYYRPNQLNLFCFTTWSEEMFCHLICGNQIILSSFSQAWIINVCRLLSQWFEWIFMTNNNLFYKRTKSVMNRCSAAVLHFTHTHTQLSC